MARDLFADSGYQAASSGRDLFADSPPESLGQSALMAIPRIGEDLYRKGYEFLQNIPGYYQQAKTEVPGVYSALRQHPAHALMQGLAGTQELINTLAQLPKTATSYAENRLNLLPQGSTEFVGKYLVPEDTTEAIHQLFGEPQYAGERLLRGVGRNADLLLGANALLRRMPHLTKRGGTKKLRAGKKLAAERNIGTLNVDPALIEDARQFLPNLLKNREELDASKAGDYNSLFNLQSNVGKISQARVGKIRSLFSPESAIKGQAGFESRNALLNAMHENLQRLGHQDISDLLREGQRDYSRYMNFRKYPRIVAGAAAYHAAPKNALIDLVKKLWNA